MFVDVASLLARHSRQSALAQVVPHGGRQRDLRFIGSAVAEVLLQVVRVHQLVPHADERVVVARIPSAGTTEGSNLRESMS